jgi:hypothetical protein
MCSLLPLAALSCPRTCFRNSGASRSNFFRSRVRRTSAIVAATVYSGPLGAKLRSSFAGILGNGFGGNACDEQH